jgi:PASTA domain
VSTKPAQPVPAPPARGPRPSSGSVNAVTVPDVTGKTILEAREILREAGFRFLIRLSDDRSKEPGIVQTQALDESPASSQSRRVVVTAVARSTVVVHAAQGDERKAEALVAYLKDEPSTIGSIVRSLSVLPRAELVGRVGYSEERLAAQAEAIAIIVGLYERAQ